jgi:hypothetical protein
MIYNLVYLAIISYSRLTIYVLSSYNYVFTEARSKYVVWMFVSNDQE